MTSALQFTADYVADVQRQTHVQQSTSLHVPDGVQSESRLLLQPGDISGLLCDLLHGADSSCISVGNEQRSAKGTSAKATWATMESPPSLPRDNSDSELNMEPQRDSSPVQLAVNRDVDNSSPLPFGNEGSTKQVASKNSQENVKAIEQFRCCINAERLNFLRKKVEDAIREKKTFTVKGGFQYIRNALLQRGWVEKIEFKTHLKNICSISDPPSMDEVCLNLPTKQEWESLAAHLAKCEKMIITRLLQHHEVDFFWNMRRDSAEWQQRLNKNKIINRFSRSLFTSKEGLCLLLQQMYWHTEPGVAYVRFPRCYTINFADQCSAFVEDFRLTACISLLKWFAQKLHNDGSTTVCSVEGKVPITVIQFAIDRCNEYVAVQKHVDLDKDFHKVWDHEWDNFLTNYYLIVHEGEKFEENGCYSLYALETTTKTTLKSLIPYWPQIELDGIKNVWIMKPGNKCRGRDIILIKDVSDVIRVMNHKLKYVVQKYIERPLLIYKTKFDIRQWFMVTCVQPLTIWMYRDCYLRFSTQKFSLESFHESVHLTNHAVQHKYSNQDRDKGLPDDNMWDNHTFKAYLRQIGHAEKWYKVIYPGMRECIIGAMLASQDTMDRRPNTFELYGADFMVAENFTPWLIEINSCPAMGPTTSVTSRMCPQCFEDLIKVTVDRRRDPKADTGLFELIYKQNLPQTPAYLGMTLSVRGKRIFKRKSANKHHKEFKKERPVIEQKPRPCKPKPKLQLDVVKNYNGPVIGNLIEELHESLFKGTVQNIEGINVPPAPAVSLVSTKPLTSQHPPGVEITPVFQKATLSFSYKKKANKNVFHSRSRKCDQDASAKENKSTKKNQSPTSRIKLQNTPIHSLSLYNKWKKGLENKSAKSTSEKNDKLWEQTTASILNNKVEMLHKSPKIVNSCIVSSIARILPEIDIKNTTAPYTQNLNLFTVGLGYKNLCYKPVIKENFILPVNNNQSNVDGCCVKL